MKKKNVVLISIDEVRPDHLSCYGYDRIKTQNIDKIAEEGILFDTCIAASCWTPLCMASTICGTYHNRHNIRGPFSHIQSKTIAEKLKDHHYKTAGFVGNGLLGARHGFGNGFDCYDEPKEDTSWGTWEPEQKERFYEGNWWIDRMVDWLKKNRSSTFFLWGHYFETHEGAEQALLQAGHLREGELSDFSYKDAKIKYMDTKLFGELVKTFEGLGFWDDTMLIIMGDHGTNLGEHPAKPVPHRPYELVYPQHTSLYDVDLRVTLIIRDKDLPRGKRIKGMVRTVDVTPTILDVLGIPAEDMNLSGISLLPIIEKGKAQGLTAYAESLYEMSRDHGALQALRTDEFKFIRDLVKGTEEFYNLQEDRKERKNVIVEHEDSEELQNIRRQLNTFLVDVKGRGVGLSDKERESVKERLRRLGYME